MGEAGGIPEMNSVKNPDAIDARSGKYAFWIL
jgi:hypothetical protein